jgi:hypothetical protein
LPRLTPIGWQGFDKFLKFIGCTFQGQEGSHLKYYRDGLSRPIIFPKDKELSRFIVKNNLRLLNISTAQFIDICQKLGL